MNKFPSSIFFSFLFLLCVNSCSNPAAKPPVVFTEPIHKITLESRAFIEGGTIPRKYTCFGDDISPPLNWDNIPKGTESFVIIMEDPDAFLIDAVHWIIYNIPGNSRELEEGVMKAKWLPNDAIHGENSFRTVGYSGPCSKLRKHKYQIYIFALDKKLPTEIGLRKNELIKKIKNHIIGFGKLSAKF